VTLDCAFPTTNLVIRDSVGQILDESVQQSGIILIPQEFRQPALFRERFKVYNDIYQPPKNTLREQDGSECGNSEAHGPAEQFPPCVLRMITFSWRRTKNTRERQHPLFYLFDLPRIAHGSLGRGP
jgi:hypothetical protein